MEKPLQHTLFVQNEVIRHELPSHMQHKYTTMRQNTMHTQIREVEEYNGDIKIKIE